ncbi:FecR family protein [Desulfobacterales bacterium HSG17]|nr:FecR family protein [Desulfobacterales bacterium HSG17]
MKKIIIPILLILLFNALSSAQEYEILEDFKPGFGEPIGIIADAQGRAVVIHAKTEQAFRLKKGILLYNGDTLVTYEDGRLGLQFKDSSTSSILSNSKIRIDRTLYDPEAGYRSSFISLVKGKARFWVKKLVDFTKRDFQVKSKTAIVGVRGSDFVVDALPKGIQVSTLEDTRLKLSLYRNCKESSGSEKNDCQVKHYELSDFQKAVAAEDALKLEISTLTQEEIRLIRKNFPQVTPLDKIPAPDALYYSSENYVKNDTETGADTISLEEIDTDFDSIEDDIMDNISDPEIDLPTYPYDPG